MAYPPELIPWRQRGLSLLEIVLALAILAGMALYFTRMIHFIDEGNKVDQCRERMEAIASELKAYYRSHQVLPAPAIDPPNSIPVGSQQLNLSQKHRLDPWGNYLVYSQAVKQDAYSGADITDVVGYDVNGRRAGGVLISLGPDQVQNFTVDATANPIQYRSAGDDLLVPVTLEEEAWDIVMEELDFLDKLVVAYDKLFAGVNNGGVDIYDPTTKPDPVPPCSDPYPDPDRRSYSLTDESGCLPAIRGGIPVRPGANLAGLDNDPNCGRATLDGWLPSSIPLDEMLQRYVYGGLNIDVAGVTEPYHTDPWGNLYQWGSPALLGVNASSDLRYHLFFSMGPDGRTGPQGDSTTVDDLTPY